MSSKATISRRETIATPLCSEMIFLWSSSLFFDAVATFLGSTAFVTIFSIGSGIGALIVFPCFSNSTFCLISMSFSNASSLVSASTLFLIGFPSTSL